MSGCENGKCGCEKIAGLSVAEIIQAAEAMGFDGKWVTDAVGKWGPIALTLALEGVRSGFSVQFVVDLLTQFGTPMLQFVIDVLNHQKMASAARGAVIEGVDVSAALEGSIVSSLLEKYLLQVLQQVGPDIIAQACAWLQANETQIIAFLTTQLTKIIGGGGSSTVTT